MPRHFALRQSAKFAVQQKFFYATQLLHRKSATVLLSSLPIRVPATASYASALQGRFSDSSAPSSAADTNMHRAPHRAHSSADRSPAMNEPANQNPTKTLHQRKINPQIFSLDPHQPSHRRRSEGSPAQPAEAYRRDDLRERPVLKNAHSPLRIISGNPVWRQRAMPRNAVPVSIKPPVSPPQNFVKTGQTKNRVERPGPPDSSRHIKISVCARFNLSRSR